MRKIKESCAGVAVVFAALTVLLAACTPEKTSQLKIRMNQGVGGFLGAVRPIDKPTRVTLGAVRSFKVKGYAHGSGDGVAENVSSFTATGKQVENGQRFLKTFQLTEMETNGKFLSASKPLVKVDHWFDKDGGAIGEIGLTFPASEDAGEIIPSETVKKLRSELGSMFSLGPKLKTYSQGDEIYSPADVQRVFDIYRTGIVLDTNSLRIKAVGLAEVFGRPALVGLLSGSAKGQINNESILIKGSGHYVIDVATSLSLSSLVKLDASVTAGGAHRFVTIITDTKITDASFYAPPHSITNQPVNATATPIDPEISNPSNSGTWEKRSIAAQWEGMSELIAGEIRFQRTNRNGHIKLTLPKSLVECSGVYTMTAQRKGAWSIGCTDGMSASGTLTAYGRGKGSSGEGRDNKGRSVKFTIGAR